MTNLRSIEGGHSPKHQAPLVISVTSGKGGVGKTLSTVNMGVAFKKMGHSVLILDGDFGLANVDIVLGIKAKHNIRDVLDGNAALKDIIVEGPMGLKIIPSGSGVSSLTNLSNVQRQQLLDQVSTFEEQFDILLIDTGAGIGENVLQFNAHSDEIVVVTTPEPHAMTDAYALIKVMSENYENKKYNLLVNQTRSTEEGVKIYERISAVAERFLKADITYLGNVPIDPQVSKSVMQRKAASEQSTFTLAGQAWNKMALSLVQNSKHKMLNQDVQDFWRNLLWSENKIESHLGL